MGSLEFGFISRLPFSWQGGFSPENEGFELSPFMKSGAKYGSCSLIDPCLQEGQLLMRLATEEEIYGLYDACLMGNLTHSIPREDLFAPDVHSQRPKS